MDLRSTQLKDTYGNLVTTGTTEGAPTSGGLQNGQGTLLTSVGIGTNSIAQLTTNTSTLHIHNSITDKPSAIYLTTDGTGATANDGFSLYVDGASENVVLNNRENTYMSFRTNSDEKLRIEADGDIAFYDDANNQGLFWDASAGSLGIGTTSPNSIIHISEESPTFTIEDTKGSGNTHTIRSTGSNGESLQLDSAQNIFLNADTHYFRSSSDVERMRIDSSGNVGMNAIPENSAGTWRNYQLGSLSMAGRANNSAPDSMFGTNFKFTTANAEQRISAHATSRIFFNDDVIIFQNAGSDTAGSAISWNERMRIDSSGNVGIGASTVDDKLHVVGTSIKIQEGGQTGITMKFNHGNNASVNSDVNIANIKSFVSSGSTGSESGGITFETRLSGTTAERMRILPSGGITFNGDTASANALDDYEEGTFDATIYEVGGSDILVEPDADYVKIGSLVHIQVRALGGTTGTSGVVRMNLPFTNTSKGGANIVAYTANNGSIVSVFCIDGTNYVEFVDTIGTIAAGNKSIGSDWGASSRLYFNFTYSTT